MVTPESGPAPLAFESFCYPIPLHLCFLIHQLSMVLYFLKQTGLLAVQWLNLKNKWADGRLGC